MHIKQELIKRDIAGDCVLVPVGKTVLKHNGLFAINELGAFIWDLLPTAENEEQLVDAVINEFDADRVQVAADVGEFLEKLRGFDIID